MPPVWTKTTLCCDVSRPRRHVVQQCAHGLARVDRVEQQAFGARQQADRVEGGLRQFAIAGRDVTERDVDLRGREPRLQSQPLARFVGDLRHVGRNVPLPTHVGHVPHRELLAQRPAAERQPGSRRARGGDVDRIGHKTFSRRLLDNFGRTLDVADRRQRRDNTAVPAKDLATLGVEAVGRFDDLAVEVFAHPAVDDFVARAEQVVEQEIPLERDRTGFRVPRQHEVAVEPRLGAGGRRLPAVVALHQPAPDEQVGPAAEGLGHHELVVPRLVAADRQSRAVVPLHEDGRPADRLREAGQVLQRRRPMSEPIAGLLINLPPKLFDVHNGDIHDGATIREVFRRDSPDQSRPLYERVSGPAVRTSHESVRTGPVRTRRVRTKPTSPDLTGPDRT